MLYYLNLIIDFSNIFIYINYVNKFNNTTTRNILI